MKRYEITDETMTFEGRTLHRVRWLSDNRLGGWIADPACLPQDGTAVLYDDDVIVIDGTFRGGTFWGGTFRGGVFEGGTFWGGTFRGGVFEGGTFHGGTFHGGTFRGGTFRGGTFRGGTFRGGEFWGGTFYSGTFLNGNFYGGTFTCSPSCAQRSDGYMFVAKIVDGELRIWAGCRDFSWDQAIAHWNDDHRHGAESRRIIEFLRQQEEARSE